MNMIIFKRNSLRKWFLCMLILFVSLPWISFAQEKEDNEPKEFRKPPEIHGTGIIDSVGDNVIVISDRQFPLSENMVKRSSEDESIISQKLKKGMEVSYELNDKKEIVTIWILKGKK